MWGWFSSPYEELVYIFSAGIGGGWDGRIKFSSPYEELVYIYEKESIIRTIGYNIVYIYKMTNNIEEKFFKCFRPLTRN